MIYQLTTQLGSPAVLLRIKTWEPPARQGSVTWSRVLVGHNPCPDMLTAPFVRFPHSGARRGFVSSEDNSERQERRGTCNSAWPGPLQERAGNWFLPTPCVSFPRGRCLHGTGGRLRWGGFWAVPATQASAQPGARAQGRAEHPEGNRAHAGPPQSQETKPKTQPGKEKPHWARGPARRLLRSLPARAQHLSQPGFSHAEKLNYQSFRLTLSPSDSPG